MLTQKKNIQDSILVGYYRRRLLGWVYFCMESSLLTKILSQMKSVVKRPKSEGQYSLL